MGAAAFDVPEKTKATSAYLVLRDKEPGQMIDPMSRVYFVDGATEMTARGLLTIESLETARAVRNGLNGPLSHGLFTWQVWSVTVGEHHFDKSDRLMVNVVLGHGNL